MHAGASRRLLGGGVARKKCLSPVNHSAIRAASGASNDYDVAVVGGGIIGLSTAFEVLKKYPAKRVVVLERELSVGMGMTGHNSGVVHAGMYYAPGSVMAKTCVRGMKLMYSFCDDHRVPYEKIGKLIVATNKEEDKLVHELYDRGTQNGVHGLEVWTGDQVRKKEPKVNATSALWSPETGIIDFTMVSEALQRAIEATGTSHVKCGFEVKKFVQLADHSISIMGSEMCQPGPAKYVTAKHVITCCGMYADRVSLAAGGDRHPKIVSFRGSYYQLKKEYLDLIKTNIYPVPNGAGIPVGIHFTPTINDKRGRQVIVGPGACPAFSREGYTIWDFRLKDFMDLFVNPGFVLFFLKNPMFSLKVFYEDINKRAFMKEAQKLIPSISEEMVEESFAGVMCQVFEPNGDTAKDYLIERNRMNGRVLNVRSCPSPAATAALAIAEHVVELAEADFEWTEKKT